MTKQDFYRKEYKRLNPSWSDSLSIYRNLIDAETGPNTRLLDVGCGRGEFLKNIYRKTAYAYGIDPDEAAIKENNYIQNKFVGTVEKLPFDSNFFDLVVMCWVLEHLENPALAFKEIHRVLKPGGQIIFLTPNTWNYNVWIIRVIPNKFHHFLTQKLYKRQEGDTYPVRYRANCVKTISKTLENACFLKKEIMLNGDPSYISFNRITFAIARVIEKILDFKPLNTYKVHIIGKFEKV